MLLKDILPEIDLEKEIGKLSVYDVTLSSKMVNDESLFIALQGAKCHGLDYLDEVKAKNAVAILSDRSQSVDGIPLIYVEGLKNRLAELLKRLYGNLLPEHIFAITGTNGKTSIANYLYQILDANQRKAISVGTIGVDANFVSDYEVNLTTPDICSFYHLLHHAKKSGCGNFIFEASSHALELGRISGVEVDIAAFTNLSHDHLDFHKDLSSYFRAKKKLFFKHLKPLGVAVINIDDPYGEKLFDECRNRGIKTITYGSCADFSYVANFQTNIHSISYFDRKLSFNHNFIAEFEISNFTCALACLYARGEDLSILVKDVSYLKPATGRMQQVYYPKADAKIIIDFAHTPDALKQALLALKKNCTGVLYVLFGCGGDRDKSKRSEMGGIAKEGADFVIVTDDNPRMEDPALIRKEIIQSCAGAVEISGRATAIKEAISRLEKNDILLIAGKGHEDYQIIGNHKNYFSDMDEVQKHIE